MKLARASTAGQRDQTSSTDAMSAGATVFFVLFLAIQTAVPLVQLWAPRPARFGWQMFTGTPQRPRFSLVMRDGTRRPADPGRYVAHSRGEVDLEKALPQHLCRVVPDLASVQITAPDSKQPRVYKCP